MIARTQDLHYLHGQRNNRELPCLLFWDRQPQIQGSGADDHMLHNMVDGVEMNAGASRNDFTDLTADVPQELGRARILAVAWLR